MKIDDNIIKFCIIPYVNNYEDIDNLTYYINNKLNIKIYLSNSICYFPLLFNLQYLLLDNWVDCNNVTDNNLQYMPNIHTLILKQNYNITDYGLQYIKNITQLHLPQNINITDNGLKYLSCITDLDLRSNRNITDNGLFGISNICILKLGSNNVYYEHDQKLSNIGLSYIENIYDFKIYYTNYINIFELRCIGFQNIDNNYFEIFRKGDRVKNRLNKYIKS